MIDAFYGTKEPQGVGVRADFAKGERMDAVVVCHGRIATEVLDAKQILEKEGIKTGVLLLEQLKPYDTVAQQVAEFLPQEAGQVVFVEEEVRAGGMGMLLSERLAKLDVMSNKQIKLIALDDSFGIQHADEPIFTSFGLDAQSIARAIMK